MKAHFQLPNDTGPIYVETLQGHAFPVEPWNTFSNLVFLAIIIYWARKMYISKQKSPFILACLPILIASYIGGTIYHATRSHEAWLMLDYIPIYLLLVMTGYYMWQRLLGTKRAILALGALLFVSKTASATFLSAVETIIPLGYGVTALSVIVPTLILGWMQRWRHGVFLFGALFFFVVAVTFRQTDAHMVRWFSQGSHFLWHLFGGFATHMLTLYIYRIEQQKAEKAEILPTAQAAGLN